MRILYINFRAADLEGASRFTLEAPSDLQKFLEFLEVRPDGDLIVDCTKMTYYSMSSMLKTLESIDDVHLLVREPFPDSILSRFVRVKKGFQPPDGSWADVITKYMRGKTGKQVRELLSK